MYKNSDLFLTVWQKIKEEDSYEKADWIIKVDSQTVFVPNRLRARIGGHAHALAHATYFANCAANSDVQSSEQPRFMYGPLEIFSHKAVETFFHGFDECKEHIGLGKSMWEERYITHCLDRLNVKINTFMTKHLLDDPHCDNGAKPDCMSTAVAFHPFDSPETYSQCWNKAQGSEGAVINVK